LPRFTGDRNPVTETWYINVYTTVTKVANTDRNCYSLTRFPLATVSIYADTCVKTHVLKYRIQGEGKRRRGKPLMVDPLLFHAVAYKPEDPKKRGTEMHALLSLPFFADCFGRSEFFTVTAADIPVGGHKL
jgi:hypothetical protein